MRPCQVLEALRRNAEERRALAREERLAPRWSCGAAASRRASTGCGRAATGGRDRALRAALRLDPDRDDLAGDLAQLLAAEGQRDEAIAELAALVARGAATIPSPGPARRRAGRGREADRSRAPTIAAALAARPDVPEVRRAARALGVALPLDDYRVDGRAASARSRPRAARYAAPAVMVLDRAVMRVFSDRAR